MSRASSRSAKKTSRRRSRRRPAGRASGCRPGLEDRQVQFRVPDDGAFAGDQEVAVQRRVPATARAVAVDGGDNRGRKRRQFAGDPLSALNVSVEFPDVGPDGERLRRRQRVPVPSRPRRAPRRVRPPAPRASPNPGRRTAPVGRAAGFRHRSRRRDEPWTYIDQYGPGYRGPMAAPSVTGRSRTRPGSSCRRRRTRPRRGRRLRDRGARPSPSRVRGLASSRGSPSRGRR